MIAAAPPVAVVRHVDDACSADELEVDAALYSQDELADSIKSMLSTV